MTEKRTTIQIRTTPERKAKYKKEAFKRELPGGISELMISATDKLIEGKPDGKRKQSHNS